MTDELKKIEGKAADGIKHLAAAYKYAKEMQEHINAIKTNITTASEDSVKTAIKLVKKMEGEYRLESREVRVVIHDDSNLEGLMEEVAKYLSKELNKEEEELKNELLIAGKTLTNLASRFRGKIKNELLQIEKDEKLMLHLPENDNLKIKILSEINALESDLQKLESWIQSDTGVHKQIKSWAEKLEKSAQ